MNIPFEISECLRGYNADTLSAMAAVWNLAPKSKEECIRGLTTLLESPMHVRKSLQSASDEVKLLLALFLEYPVVYLADLLSVRGLYCTKEPVEIIRTAVLHGWLLIAPTTNAGVFVLNDLNRVWSLNESSPGLFLLPTVQFGLNSVPYLSLQIKQEEEQKLIPLPILKDWATEGFLEILRVVDINQPRLNATGTVHRSDFTRMQEQARESGLPSDSFKLLLQLAQVLKCVHEQHGHLVVSPYAEEWVKKPAIERSRDLFYAFMSLQELVDVELFFPELFSALETYVPKNFLRRIYHRKLATESLKGLQALQWYRISDFIRAIYQRDSNVLFLDAPWRAIQSQVRGDIKAWRENAWRTHEERYYQWLIRIVLTGMGLIEVDETGTFFRITENGFQIFHDTEEVSSAQQEQNGLFNDAIVIQPDFEIIAFLERCSPELRRRLDSFCERVTIGPVAIYRITEESVRRGIASGFPLETFLQLLANASTRPIPSNVSDQFTTWIRKSKAVVIHTNCDVLEGLSETDISTFLETTDGVRKIGDRFAICEHADMVDCPVTISSENPDEPFLEPYTDLMLFCPWEKVNLYCARQVEKFGQIRYTPDGNFLLEIDKSKIPLFQTWEDFITELEKYCRQPLPARYRVALRAFSDKDVTAELRKLTLIRFQDAETAEAIWELSVAKDIFEGRLGKYTLIVREGKVGDAKKLLKNHQISFCSAALCWNDNLNGENQKHDIEHTILSESNEDKPKKARENKSPSRKSSSQTLGELPCYPPNVIQEILEDAIKRRKYVVILYTSTVSDRAETRIVRPVSLEINSTSPSLNAICAKENISRQFKLSRIRGIRILEDKNF